MGFQSVALLVIFAATACARLSPPNVVWVMADDLDNDWKDDRLAYMPTLRTRMRDEGTFFEHHVAAQPVCGPSRSSLLLGRYPHNTGYVSNDDLDSVAAFLAQHNNTIGTWLAEAGYYTAFHGKYVNSVPGVPSGWSHWGGFIQTYDFYNASMYAYEEGEPAVPGGVRVMTGVHQADFLGQETLASAKRALAQNKPFFVHTTPVMPHWGTCYGPVFPPGQHYAPTDPHWEFDLTDPQGRHWAMPISPCPTDRHKHAFDGQRNRHVTGMWNVTAKGKVPEWMRESVDVPGRLTAFQAEREHMGWRNRSAALLDLDDMLKVIFTGLDSLGVLNNTYVIFSSDNGYHLGEHKMPFGKGEPYETDIRLPMYIRGPGVYRNKTLPHPTTHLDITRTVVDIAQAHQHAPSNLDGKSFLAELSDLKGDQDDQTAVTTWSRAEAWRQFSFSEFHTEKNTWRMVRVVNSSHTFSYHAWCTNDTEVFDLQTDPHQMSNLYGETAFAEAVDRQYRPLVAALGGCTSHSCSQPTPTGQSDIFACQKVIQGKNALQGHWNLLPMRKPGAQVTQLHGWSANFREKGGPHGSTRGWPSNTVRLLLNGKRTPLAPDQVANVSRPDLVAAGLAPNPEHGFLWKFPANFFPKHPAKHKVDIQVLVGGRPHWLNGKPDPQCVCDGARCPC